ncbi:hypothetical protein B0H14DRAFT_2614340 [Mycena olivaceomarginata]|nr:hypothetical protein B0H14DRAFT_2614340 [Mycena olivaceomarginata]
MDSNQRLYYKLPQQLEVHHKNTILWKSECATLSEGSNFLACKPLVNILNSIDSQIAALPPNSLPDGELDTPGVSIDPRSFNPMAGKPTTLNDSDSIFIEDTDVTSMLKLVPNVSTNSQPPDLTLFPGFTSSTIPHPAPPVQPTAQQSLLPGASAPSRSAATTQSRCCAPCIKVLCPKRDGCLGKGRHKFCICGHPPLKLGERVHWTEAMVLAKIAA